MIGIKTRDPSHPGVAGPVARPVRGNRRAAGFALAVVALSALAFSASAQAPAPPKPPAPPAPPAQIIPYDTDLLRLSEIMGALHFLVQLCDGEGTSRWREQMTALLDAEQPDPDRRARFVDRFNRGFDTYRSVYRTCTDSARLAMARYEKDGAAVAAGISARYGRGA